MILYVFEGEKRELEIFLTIQHLFFHLKENNILRSFGNNIFNLYKKITDDGKQKDERFYNDIISIIREKEKDNPEFSEIKENSQISEIYLFFDFDLQDRDKTAPLSLEEKLRRIKTLLDFFSDETDQGKLYINYPMVESFRYTKTLPDLDYWKYEYKIKDFASFKTNTARFSDYPNLDFACYRIRNNTISQKDDTEKRREELKKNWGFIILQNLKKTNFLCNDHLELPENKESISQIRIFENQDQKYIKEKDSISILNSFPLFLFDYFEATTLLSHIMT